MSRIQRKLDQVKSDLLKLIGLLDEKTKENEILKQELQNLRLDKVKEEREFGREEIKDDGNQSIPVGKNEIDDLISEIDDCINMLKAEQ